MSDQAHTATSAPFQALSDDHKIIDEFFVLHQEALIIRDMGLAVRFFALFRRRLLQHIALEDEYVLPRYAQLPETAQWPTRVYTGEHRKLEAGVAKIQKMLKTLQGRAVTRRDILALLDQEGRLRRLSEHHHEREEQALYPALEKHSDPSNDRELAQTLTQAVTHLDSHQRPVIGRLQRRLQNTDPREGS